MKKVSILIPCYNSETFVAETIECCLNQTYSEIEVVVVDDGSTDKSYEIAKSYESDKVNVYQQTNSGACQARNHAFEKCTGDYVVYLDADDILNPVFVEEQVKHLNSAGENCISFCPWDRFRGLINEAEFPTLCIYKDYDDAFQLLLDLWTSGTMLQTSCYMTPRHLIEQSGGWDEKVLKNQDGEFFARVLILANKALFVPNAKVYYRTVDYLTVSKASSEKKVASMLDTFISYKNNALAREDSERVRKALAVNFTLFMYIHGNEFPGLFEKARKEVKKLGVGYQLNTQPARVQKICKIIGFDNFMRLRKLLLNR